ncbi:type VI secretion system contractile sheath small subunit, partial [Salmonella enterica subsp. enterica serovar Typhimurium]|nr:type VI secretion system contractile sheath small subunit [Salmonella enterica subsp. enterica serovar Typhimurium]ECN2898771.1 type VI secretion system contractile sheath small subunit [Salmonella enterica subsp. enterica serovar Typhimurium]
TLANAPKSAATQQDVSADNESAE